MRMDARGRRWWPLPTTRSWDALRWCALAIASVAAVFAAGTLAGAAHGEASWPTYHRDAQRSGYDPDATEAIEPALAWQSGALGAPIWGQPLIVGSRVYAATVGDRIIALDASSGAVVWEKTVGAPVPDSKLACGDIHPTVGIVGTPVIDVAGGVIYAVADTWKADTEKAQHVLVGLGLADGSELLRTVVDPPGAEPRALLQRTALNLDGHEAVFGFGGNDGDCGSYRGAVVAAPTDGSAPRFWRYQPVAPSIGGAAVWGTGGPVVDGEGHVYASTGNPNTEHGEQVTTYDYSDSLLELDSEMNQLGAFEPPTWLFDSNHDVDLGSAAPELLPDGLVFQAGKNGVGYLLDQTGFPAQALAVYEHQVCSGHGSFGGDALAGGVIYIPCTNGTQALSLTLGSAPSFTSLWQGPADAFGPPIVSAGLVWSVATGGFSGGGTKLYGLDPATGKPRYTVTLPSGVADHFASPSAAGGRLFVATGSTVTAVQIAKPAPPAPPTVAAKSATSVTETSAVLNATVNPNGSAVEACHFDYGATEAYGQSAPCSPMPGSGTSPVAVSAAPKGLTPGTSYHFRIVASGPGGSGEGADQTFTTAEPPPLISPLPVPGPSQPGSPAAAPAQGALPSVVAAPQPNASLAARSVAVGRSGRLLLPVHCSSGERVCMGTVRLTTLHAVRARTVRGRAAEGSRRVLMLTAGAFTVPVGRTRRVALRLRPRARVLLARARSLSALATLNAHDSAGAVRTTRATVALRLVQARRG